MPDHVKVVVAIDKYLSRRKTKPTDAFLVEKMTSHMSSSGWESLTRMASSTWCPDIVELQTQDKLDNEPPKRSSQPRAYTDLLIRKNEMWFVDVELGRHGQGRVIEIDVFCPHHSHSITDDAVDAVIKCFRLPASTKAEPSEGSFIRNTVFGKLRSSRSTVSQGISQLIPQHLDLLMTIKQRGKILRSDLLQSMPGLNDRENQSTIAKLSRGKHPLLSREKALICKATNEIVFILDEEQESDGIGPGLRCPKCKSLIKDEKREDIFELSPKCREAIDGNSWMPALAVSTLVQSGVPSDCVLTEVFHGKDEIDLVISWGRKIIVCEAKARDFSLNDAYKLMSKIERLKSKIADAMTGGRKRATHQSRRTAIDPRNLARASAYGSFEMLPMVLCTGKVSADAKDLILDINPSAVLYEEVQPPFSELSDWYKSIRSEYVSEKFEMMLRSPDSFSALLARLVSQSLRETFYEYM